MLHLLPLHAARRAAIRAPLTCLTCLMCLLAALTGCLSVPEGPTPMCVSTLDCQSELGEVCEEGVCYGNPPGDVFAAVISPPSTRPDAVPRELPPFTLSSDGWMGDLQLDRAVLFNGRIVAFCPAPMTGCDAVPLAATVTVSRRSLFRGGPGFKTIVNVEGGADSFSIPLPPTSALDAPYTITITPDGTRPIGVKTASPAEVVPPLRMQLGLTSSSAVKVIELGGQRLSILSGRLRNAADLGLAGYRVVALGRWDESEPATEVSTVAITDPTGTYKVILSAGLVGPVQLVAQPFVAPGAPTAGVVAPTVRIANIDSTGSSVRDIEVPSLGNPTTVKVVVTGLDLDGEISKVRGAVVSVSGVVVPRALTSFAVSDEQVTDDQGEVTLRLLDGMEIADTYRLSVAPPASSRHSAKFDQKLTIGAAATEVSLIARIALRGFIHDSAGKPLANVAITSRPALRFLWSLPEGPQAFLSAIPTATTVTPPTGEFVLWVDPTVGVNANAGVIWGHYDLMIEPPTTAQAPTYIATELEIPRTTSLDAFSVGTLTLPDAAYIHGQISDSNGATLEGAEIKLYLVEPQSPLCSEVAHAPATCPIPAQLKGRDTSDARGAVRVVLPRSLTP